MKYTSRHGGNVPDVWAIGTCEACEGSGDASCEDCGDAVATHEYFDPHNKRNRFVLCKDCFDEWTTEDAEERMS